MTTIPLPTGPTKGMIIDLAYSDCASAGYMFGRTDGETAAAMRMLDAMMCEWPFDSIGYLNADNGVGRPEDESGIDKKYLQAVSTSLALRLAPEMGKTLSPEQVKARTRSYDRLCSIVAASEMPKQKYARNTPAGAGQRVPLWPAIFFNEQ